MVNTLLSSPVHIADSDRAMHFTGNVVSEDKRTDYSRLLIDLSHIEINDRSIGYDQYVEFYTRSDETLLGKRVTIAGTLGKSDNPDKPHVLTGRIIATDDNSFFWSEIIYPVRYYILKSFAELFDPQKCDLASALILGGSGRITPQTKDLFSRAGILHILAVSGLHVGFVCAFVSALLFFIPISIRWKFGIIMVVLVLYSGLTGFRPSICRASIMAFFFGLGLIAQRNVDRIHITNMTALVFLVYKPSLLFDIGGQLSFAAVYGIFTLFPIIEAKFIKAVKSKFIRMMMVPLAISFSAQIYVVPLLVYYFQRFSNVTVFANFLIVPLASICVFMLYVILISQVIHIFFAQCVAFIVTQLFASLLFITQLFAWLPFAVMTMHISAVFIPFCYLLISRKTRMFAAYGLLILAYFFTLAGFIDCLIIRATTFGVMATTKSGHLFVTDQCQGLNTARLLSHHQIGDLDYLIAPRAYFPSSEMFIELSDPLYTQNISLGQILIKTGRKLEIYYRDHMVYTSDQIKNTASKSNVIEYIITDGDKTFSFSAPHNCSILDQMIIDAKTKLFTIAILF